MLKVAWRGLSALQLLELIVHYPWRSSSLTHLQRRHRTKRHQSPLLANEGTFFIEGILLAIRNSQQLLGSFTCRKVGTWDRLFNSPPRRGACWGFFTQKKSKGFGRVCTRGLGNQRPTCEPLDHRSRHYINVTFSSLDWTFQSIDIIHRSLCSSNEVRSTASRRSIKLTLCV
jgi:hypothetical protein